MAKNEKQTRIELIDPALERAGWHVLKDLHIVQKDMACIETPVVGMPKTLENSTGNGFVDYVLFGDDGKPLALVEAKKSVVNEERGRAQACLYADALEKQYGLRPIIYYTNGYNIKIIDGLYPARQVFGFHKKDELEYLIQRRNFVLKDKTVNPDICNRYYQIDAIEEVLKHLGTKHSRSLIVLATGTGKTRVSCGISDIFIRNNMVKRILFLADRKNLVKQAKEDTYEKFLPSVPMAIIAEGKREGDENKARIVFSTYQSMLSIIKDTEKCPYGIGHFDLIIVDEAHRSLFNKYAEIFTYFDALMIGLTATPRNDIHKSTYRVFNLDNDEPNYEYDVVKGVKDGYLTYYRALDRTPDILKNGLTYDSLSNEEQEQYEDLFTEEDGTIPEKIEGKEFYSVITNKDTIRKVLADLMEEGIKVNNGDTLGKTIIFAKDHNHAILIQDTFREMYPELCIPGNPNGVDYCVVIDTQIRYNEILQREFKEKQSIRIVVSVDMMDTGVDIPEVVNLVFFKKVLSKIKFWQMIGRGTRTCANNKPISPAKTYFERQTNDATRQQYNDKQGFLIFDICNVFPFFKENPEGKEDKSSDVLSLYQKIYMEKVALYKAMQSNYGKLSIDDKKLYEKLRDDLIAEVRGLNRNYIGVKANLETVDKYCVIANWLNLDQKGFADIKKKIAPNVIGEIDIESARAFDYLCYKFAATRFYSGKDFKKVAKTIYSLVSYLHDFKYHVSQVSEHISTLEYVMTDEFINDSTVSKVDEIRDELRDLIRYIDKKVFDPIVSDFSDQISSFNDAIEDDVDFRITIDDFKTFEDKVKFYIESNPKNDLIYSVSHLIKPTANEIQALKNELVIIAKTADEYYSLFPEDKDIVRFVRSNIEFNPDSIAKFVGIFQDKGYNDMQLAYIKELLLFISENGSFDRQDLLRPELSFNGIMNSLEIKFLISKIQERI
ncbi:MAG: DEAD/DEAH box helicase family protein [Clostridia bacterium]|nr:DEAD/DEAH box helicase family protein [Clostridia bacterium]